mmetsp:Transcript_2025/g.2293  ORF Transcript_2025/g.2293 Transcript_2025/m.2293 type:complete len:94 (+) Transcript_2025:363-644(+)
MEIISEPVDGAEDALTNSGLKWSSPDVSDFQLEDHLNKGELDFFSEELPVECAQWDEVAQARIRLLIAEGGEGNEELSLEGSISDVGDNRVLL